MPKTASATERTSTTLTFFVGLSVLGVFFLTVGYFSLVKKITSLSLPEATPAAPQMVSAEFTCDQNKTINAVFLTDRAELSLSDSRSFLLLQGLSADGARYTNTDESVTFWNKGNTAFLEENGKTTFANCTQTDAN